MEITANSCLQNCVKYGIFFPAGLMMSYANILQLVPPPEHTDVDP